MGDQIDPVTDATSVIALAIGRFNAGDEEEAVALLDTARQLVPDDPMMHFKIGYVLCLSDQPQHALEFFAKAVELRPDYGQAYSYRAYTYARLGRYAEALADGQEALRHNPTSAKAYVQRGMAYAGVGQKELAAQDFREAIRLDNEPGAADEARFMLEDFE